MGELDGEVLEGGCFQIFLRGAVPGWMFLVLSPEGDSHRLIRLVPERGRLAGRVMAVAGRPTNLLRGMPPATTAVLAAGPVAAGEYRLVGDASETRLHFLPHDEDDAATAALAALDDGGGCVVLVVRPGFGNDTTLPADLSGRFGHRATIAADPPHFLDYVGVRLLLTPARQGWEAVAAMGQALPLPLGLAQ